MPQEDYVHRHLSDSEEYERLRKIEEILDPRTKVFLERLGLKAGMSFLEAGAGGGGLLLWVSKAVGPAGKVLAIDLNTRFLESLKGPNLDVVRGDLTQMDLGTERFDFIHERYVLTHIPAYQAVLGKMKAALKPGGWILLEDVVSEGRMESPNPARPKALHAMHQARRLVFAAKGMDSSFGLLLPGLLRQTGFTQVGEETFAPLDRGGEGQAEIMRLSVLGLWDQYLATGAVTGEELKTFVEMASDPTQSAVYYSTVSAWGRKPGP